MLYEYICPKCLNRFEFLKSVADRDKAECPKCNTPAQRLLPTGTRSVWVGPPEWASAWK